MAAELEEDTLEEKKAPHSKKIMIIIIIASVVLLAMMGAGFFVLWNKVTPQEPQQEQKHEEKKEEEAKDTIKPIYSLSPFIVNLADKDESRYMRVTMDLELANEETTKEVEKRLPQVRDAILMIIPAKTVNEVSSVEGKIALRDEIMQRLNSFIKNGSVTNIYFTEFVIQ